MRLATKQALTLILVGMSVQACISPDDGEIGASGPRECSPKPDDPPPLPPPRPCNDDVACRQFEPGQGMEASEWISTEIPLSPGCRFESDALTMHAEDGDCVLSFAFAPTMPLPERICRPMLIHDYAETFSAFDMRLQRFTVDGVSQISTSGPVSWRGADWRTSFSWQHQRDETCHKILGDAESDAFVEMVLRIPMRQWLSLQTPKRPALVLAGTGLQTDTPQSPY